MTSAIDSVPTHPIPPRVKDGPEVPFIGPHYQGYLKAHAETVGPAADKWWAKVCLLVYLTTRFKYLIELL